MNSQTKTLGAAVIIVVAAFLFFKKNKQETTALPARVEAKQGKVESSGQSLVETQQNVSRKELAEARRSFSKMMTIGVQVIPSQKKGEGVSIATQLQVTSAGCNVGEYDLLKNITADLSQKSILLAVESPEGQEQPVFRQRLSVFDISDNPTVTMNIAGPNPTGKGYMVSLCMDEANQQSCQKKKVLKPEEWQAEMNSSKANNFLFYTQLIVVKDQVAYLAPSQRFDEKSLKRLKERLAPIWSDIKGFETFSEKVRALGPVPAAIIQKGLQIRLPARQSGC